MQNLRLRFIYVVISVRLEIQGRPESDANFGKNSIYASFGLDMVLLLHYGWVNFFMHTDILKSTVANKLK